MTSSRRRRRNPQGNGQRRVNALVLAGAAAVGLAVGLAPAVRSASAAPSYSVSLNGCRVTDGDTLRCGGERVRLLGIDAPELPGHCRRGRACAPGDPYASTSSLRAAATGALTIERLGTDQYGRTLALVAGARGDLSCWQLRQKQAVYKRAWDDEFRIALACPGAAL